MEGETPVAHGATDEALQPYGHLSERDDYLEYETLLSQLGKGESKRRNWRQRFAKFCEIVSTLFLPMQIVPLILTV